MVRFALGSVFDALHDLLVGELREALSSDPRDEVFFEQTRVLDLCLGFPVIDDIELVLVEPGRIRDRRLACGLLKEELRDVIFLDNIGSFALRSNLMGVGAAFNACFASFHQLADNFRKPNLSADEIDELFTASRGNVARLDDWLKEIQKLVDEKQQRHKTLAEQIASLNQKWETP
jgi:hypothetical protein